MVSPMDDDAIQQLNFIDVGGFNLLKVRRHAKNHQWPQNSDNALFIKWGIFSALEARLSGVEAP